MNAPESKRNGVPKGQPEPREIAHAALRGAIAAMAMTGMRILTQDLGIVKESPPQAIVRQRVKGFLRSVPGQHRRAAIEVAHWTYGAGGGALFGALPAEVRRRRWFGPLYGLGIWAGFELVIAPVLALRQAKEPRVVERLALAVDHLLYGLVLSETRAQPRR